MLTSRTLATELIRGMAWMVVCAGVACDDGLGPSERVRSITVEPAKALSTAVGAQVRFEATARDRSDHAVRGIAIAWEILDPSVASIDTGGVVTGIAAGATVIRARFDTIVGDATFEVYVDPNTGPFLSGESYRGRRNYVEYFPGSLPVVISAPHGGDLAPAEIADRTFGVTGTDRNTRDLTLRTRDSIFARTGRYPHVIVSHLRRSKLDPNREIVEAAQGDVFAEQAWREFHRFIEIARAAVAADHQRGLYLDYHGHGHAIPRIELGYLLSADDLAKSDDALNSPELVDKSSIRQLAHDAPASMAELVRGPVSFGTLLEETGYPTVPSTSQPDPGSDPYFTGGYNTQQYGSRAGGSVSGIQVEANYPGIRDTEENRGAFAAAMTSIIGRYLIEHFGIDWNTGQRTVSCFTVAVPGREVPLQVFVRSTLCP